MIIPLDTTTWQGNRIVLYYRSCVYWLGIKPRLSQGQQCNSFVVIEEIPEICFRMKYSLLHIVLIQAGIFSPQDNWRSKKLADSRSSVAYLLILLTSSSCLYNDNAYELISSCQIRISVRLCNCICLQQIILVFFSPAAHPEVLGSIPGPTTF
jgi:hypothetical protein